jgi:hypothetical protein
MMRSTIGAIGDGFHGASSLQGKLGGASLPQIPFQFDKPYQDGLNPKRDDSKEDLTSRLAS